MTKTKVWYGSRTILVSMFMMFANMLSMIGIAVSPESIDFFVTMTVTLTTVIGSAMAIYGRFTATEVIEPIKPIKK